MSDEPKPASRLDDLEEINRQAAEIERLRTCLEDVRVAGECEIDKRHVAMLSSKDGNRIAWPFAVGARTQVVVQFDHIKGRK